MLNENDKKVIRGIANAVRARGEDWVYPNYRTTPEQVAEGWSLANENPCYNLLHDGTPACIIGFIAVDQGLPTKRATSAGSDAVRWGVSRQVQIAMIHAQSAQDLGATWGAAMQSFDDVLVKTNYVTAEELAEIREEFSQ